MIEDPPTGIYFFPNMLIFLTLTDNKKILAEKIENQASQLCAEFNADSKTVLVFILALIVFDFYSFEGSKNTFYRRAKYKYKCIYIYIYNTYIYKYIYIYIECYYFVLKI